MLINTMVIGFFMALPRLLHPSLRPLPLALLPLRFLLREVLVDLSAEPFGETYTLVEKDVIQRPPLLLVDQRDYLYLLPHLTPPFLCHIAISGKERKGVFLPRGQRVKG